MNDIVLHLKKNEIVKEMYERECLNCSDLNVRCTQPRNCFISYRGKEFTKEELRRQTCQLIEQGYFYTRKEKR